MAEDLPDEIVSGILLLLPPKAVLRCRAVCRSWRRLATDPAFLLAHHRRQPPLPLFALRRPARADPEAYDFRVEALDLRTRASSPIVRFTASPHDAEIPGSFIVHGCSGGIVLVSCRGDLYACNPATRQWALLPPLHNRRFIIGFYPHRPSGELRVLYARHLRGEKEVHYMVYSLGSGDGEGRRLRLPTPSTPVDRLVGRGLGPTCFHRPAMLHGNLHWRPRPSVRDNTIPVFDTVAETFRWLRPPFVHGGGTSPLFEKDGLLAMASTAEEASPLDVVDVWVLEDYEREAWVRKYRIELPLPWTAAEISFNYVQIVLPVSREGDVLVQYAEFLLHYDANGNLLGDLQYAFRWPNIVPHVLKESLLPHAVFQTRQEMDGDGDGVRVPPFFDGDGGCVFLTR